MSPTPVRSFLDWLVLVSAFAMALAAILWVW